MNRAPSGNELEVALRSDADLPPDKPDCGEHPLGEAESLYREHHEFVWRNARRLGADESWGDDAVHEVFLVATRRWSEFEGRSSVRTWLFGITLRVVQRMRRDRARYDARLRRMGDEPAPVENVPHEQHDAARSLRRLLAELDEAKRVVVILAELEGMTTAEIAEELGLKRGTVDSRLRAARIALLKAIKRERAREERRTREP